jgi:DNA-binding CsgD family transcriptional regulator
VSALRESSLLDAVACIGAEKDLDGFRTQTVAQLSRLVPCEQVFSVLEGALPSRSLERPSVIGLNIPEDAMLAYLHHYHAMDPVRKAANAATFFFCEDWRRRILCREVFAVEFVRDMLHVDFSAGISFLEPSGVGGICFGLTRKGVRRLERSDEQMFFSLRPHLQNIYNLLKRLGKPPPGDFFTCELAPDMKLLSRREAEVATLLCRRLRPAQIAALLLISARTVERHIENVYGKLNVNNRKQLLARLLGPTNQSTEGVQGTESR